jgi:hypothetical protein
VDAVSAVNWISVLSLSVGAPLALISTRLLTYYDAGPRIAGLLGIGAFLLVVGLVLLLLQIVGLA